MDLSLIASADINWGIGYKNKLLFHIPMDMAYFKEKTWGHAIVMGKNTFLSLPSSQPLRGRENIVLSSTMEPSGQVVVCGSVGQVLAYVAQKKAFIIGGQQIYNQFLPHCHTAYITKIQHDFPKDTYLPNLDQDSNWKLVDKSEEFSHKDIKFCFLTYRRVENA